MCGISTASSIATSTAKSRPTQRRVQDKRAHGAGRSLGELRSSGDLGFQWMTYRICDLSGAVVDVGKLLTLFQRKNGKWMIVGDTWNSNVAASAPQPRHS